MTAQAPADTTYAALAAAAADVIAERTGVERHDAVLVIGSGWDPAADAFGRQVAEVPVGDLPGFVAPVAPGQRGTVCSYDLDGHRLLVFFGRTHIFEGHGPRPVAQPVRTAAAAGARVAVLTNATGSMRPDWSPGTPVLIRDHLNWTRISPIEGAHFVDLTEAWSPRLRGIARDLDPTLVEGVYALHHGPSVQSGAETRMLRGFGADLVGMSVAIEAIAVREAGMELMGLSCASTLEDAGVELDPEHIIEIVNDTARRMGPLLAGVLTRALESPPPAVGTSQQEDT